MMACSVEKILADACRLSLRLREHDTMTDSVIIRTQTLQRQVEAMKQFQESLNELNEKARHRPRANLILGLAQENCQIRDLQAENKELRQSLEEHQSALELIMSKYREQISRLSRINGMDESLRQRKTDYSQELLERAEKINEMAAVMWRAAEVDDRSSEHDRELIARLRTENESIRQLLQISSCPAPIATHDTTDKCSEALKVKRAGQGQQDDSRDDRGTTRPRAFSEVGISCRTPVVVQYVVVTQTDDHHHDLQGQDLATEGHDQWQFDSSLENSVLSSSSTDSIGSCVSKASIVHR